MRSQERRNVFGQVGLYGQGDDVGGVNLVRLSGHPKVNQGMSLGVLGVSPFKSEVHKKPTLKTSCLGLNPIIGHSNFNDYLIPISCPPHIMQPPEIWFLKGLSNGAHVEAGLPASIDWLQSGMIYRASSRLDSQRDSGP